MSVQTIPNRHIADLVAKVSTRDPGLAAPNDKFTYVDISAIDQQTKAIADPKFLIGREAPSRARQEICAGDVLVSTVRPNLNSVALVSRSFDGAIASTGFCVLRPIRDRLDSGYLFQWVRSPEFVRLMVGKATGASYPAVSDTIVRRSVLPYPPIAEQRRIAAILDQADALRAKRRAALAHLDEMAQAIFDDLFLSDPDRETVTIADVSLSMRTGPFGSQLLHSEFVQDGVAVLGIDNAVLNRFEWFERRFITERKFQELARFCVQPRDVIVTIMGTCGRAAIVPKDIPRAITTKHLCSITLNQSLCLPEFLHACLLSHPAVRNQLGATARGAVMPGLNMGLIKQIRIPLPPIALQSEFARRLSALDRYVSVVTRSGQALGSLFASLQHRAFNGQL